VGIIAEDAETGEQIEINTGTERPARSTRLAEARGAS
jgi:hypothetical protein